MDDLIRDFLVESHEGLERLDRDLVALETAPRDPQLLAAIFRTIHTVKGTCSFLGFSRLEAVSHAGENLLSKLRDGKLEMSPHIAGGLLALVDVVRQMLAQIEATGSEGEGDDSPLIALLEELQQPPAAPPIQIVAKAPPPPPPPKVEVVAEKKPEVVAEKKPEVVAEKKPDVVEKKATEGQGGISDQSVRVDVSLLDRMMNLVGELVLSRNQLLQVGEGAAHAALQRLNLVTTELQEVAMASRLQPIGNAWSKLPRMVRDLEHACGKRVRLVMEGENTDLDRSLLESIRDPLTHLIRNAIDHGVEPPQVRAARSKPEVATVLLRAFQEGGHIVVEVTDDGAGIDSEKVKEKAIERGLIRRDDASHLSQREVFMLLCVPGFSTAEKVTSVSGRGVGMDVVKTNIERAGGTIHIESKLGQGTTVRIRIPLTLAIVPALIVESGGHRFAIPQVSLQELVRIDPSSRSNIVEKIDGKMVYRLRGTLLPLVVLSDVLPLPKMPEDGRAFIAVLEVGGTRFGLVVEQVRDTKEIVVKPLGKELKALSVYAGATILGDGSTALILDVAGIARRAGLELATSKRAEAEVEDLAEDASGLLLLEVGEARMAVPLPSVTRLERLVTKDIEYAAGSPVIQYRGDIMPLVFLAQPSAETIEVVVTHHAGHPAGLVVSRILDVVEGDAPVGDPRERGPKTGVFQGRVTELIDLNAVVGTGVVRHLSIAA